jgi:hypothetical protein
MAMRGPDYTASVALACRPATILARVTNDSISDEQGAVGTIKWAEDATRGRVIVRKVRWRVLSANPAKNAGRPPARGAEQIFKAACH